MILWRIATETRTYGAEDVTGTGASIEPGRWNDVGEKVLYTAPTIAIAVLETAAHIDDAGLPLNRFLVRITLPDVAWDARQTLDLAKLPPQWSAIPAGVASVAIGSAWLRAGKAPCLEVPSVIVPEETVVLVNPGHPLSAGLRAQAIRPFEYDRLFRPA